MTEDFLYYIWKFRLFKIKSKTTDGVTIEIISVGERNTDSGPDFINARIKVGNTLWAGNVEIHVNSSDWFKHKHQSDKAYNNIILHVVYENDADIYRNKDDKIPVFELKNKFNKQIYDNYMNFIESKSWIPCHNLIANADMFVVSSWLEALTIERLERKVEEIDTVFENNKNDWEETFYQFLSRNFGFKINALPFEMLAKVTPFEYLIKHRDNLFQLEAILFGQAGMLNKDFKDEYFNRLKHEYTYLKCKFNLVSIDNKLWKFLRLRPSNFPTIRIAQFAWLIHNTPALFSKVKDADSIGELSKMLSIKTSEYWRCHFVPEKISRERERRMGEMSIQNIILNTVVPFIFLYGIKKDNFAYKDKALKYMEKIKPENNKIINSWESIGLKAVNSFESQALIELKHEYCDKKRCLECRIGLSLMKELKN